MGYRVGVAVRCATTSAVRCAIVVWLAAIAAVRVAAMSAVLVGLTTNAIAVRALAVLV